MSVKIVGNSSGNVAEVNSNNQVAVNLPTTATQAGYATMLSEVDAGSLLGSRTLIAPLTTEDRRLLTGLDTPMFNYTFNAVAQDTGVWRYLTSTMTTTFGTSGLLMNASSSLVSANGTVVSSYRYLSMLGGAGMRIQMNVQITAAPLTNQAFECGLFPYTGAIGVPTEGVYFRYTTAGLIGVLNYNTLETTTGVLLAAGSFPINTSVLLQIIVTENQVQFWYNGAIMANGILAIPVTYGQPFITTSLPFSYQFRNVGTVSGSPVMQVKVTNCHVDQRDFNLSKPYPHVQAGLGLQAYQGTSGNTMGTTAAYTNSSNASAGAALTNTAATATGLGGFVSVQPTLAQGTDGIITGYQVPAGTINITPRTLYITGIKIIGAVTTALTGGPVIYAYSLGYGATAVSLATAEGAATKAPRRIPLGYESYPATSAVAVLGQGVSMQFISPVVVNPGEFVTVVAKNLGTVTSGGVITFMITFDGYWE